MFPLKSRMLRATFLFVSHSCGKQTGLRMDKEIFVSYNPELIHTNGALVSIKKSEMHTMGRLWQWYKVQITSIDAISIGK